MAFRHYHFGYGLVLLLALLLTACAGVKVSSVTTTDYMMQRRGDILTSGNLSTASLTALQIVGLTARECRRNSTACRQILLDSAGLNDEQRLAALAELWLQEALQLEKHYRDFDERVIDAYINTVRYAYAYLFFTERTPEQRAFEDRQTQVRDYYNYAVQQAITALFKLNEGNPPLPDEQQSFHIRAGSWDIRGDMKSVRLALNRTLPQELIPAGSLSFAGVRNQYRRDGFGAELVAVTAKRVLNSREAESFIETPFPSVTGLMSFNVSSLQQILETHDVMLHGYDPYRQQQVRLAGREVPLAANFTAGYGLWLARSGFARQALKTLVGRGEALDAPRVYLMQPYDPDRRIIIMLHGLASSPEAWINVANEVFGDETLRQNYQIWQVYYPTNAPLIWNLHDIRQAINRTLQHFDPESTARASQDIVLVGHSMGGLLSRLLVSSSGDMLWEQLVDSYKLVAEQVEKARPRLDPYLRFEPLPQVSRAVFIATPHRGTPFAENRFARWASGLVSLPVTLLERFKEMGQLLIDPSSAPPEGLTRPLNSIDNLSDKDGFIKAAAEMPVSPGVRYHSIIGNDTPSRKLSLSDDGVVPYSSAHLAGAASETVIPSWHSVQETPQAIMEIRRILHLSLSEDGKAE